MPKIGKTKVAAKCHKLIHPQSRKANKLGAREMHKERVKKVHQETKLRNAVLMEKLTWFKDALDPEKQNYSKADAQDLVSRYLGRFEEELEQISIVNSMKSRSGRQHAAREDVINATNKREQELFRTCGIEIPDIIDARNLKLFRAWDGNPKFISTLKMRKIVRTVSDTNPSMNSSRQSTSQDRNGDHHGDQIDVDEEDSDIGDDVLDEMANDEDDDDDEGVEDDILDSDSEDRSHGLLQESLDDEGVESH